MDALVRLAVAFAEARLAEGVDAESLAEDAAGSDIDGEGENGRSLEEVVTLATGVEAEDEYTEEEQNNGGEDEDDTRCATFH